jgi:hypothetical protein
MSDEIEQVQKEVKGNRDFLREQKGRHCHELIFVNGHLYKGVTIFDRYKGLGWKSGRTAEIAIDHSVPTDAEVFVVDLSFGRIRRCKWKCYEDGSNLAGERADNCWDVIDLPEDA